MEGNVDSIQHRRSTAMLSNDSSQRLLYKSLPFQGNVVVITQVLQHALTLRWSAMAYRYDLHLSPDRLANAGLLPGPPGPNLPTE
jgi:hypothetical protein